MCQVMIDVADAVSRVSVQVANDLCENSVTGVDILVERGGGWIERVDGAMRGVVESVHDLVHIVECDACFFKTVGNGADGKIARVFFPAEALLGGSSDQFAVNEQGSRGVVPLRDAIFAIFQVGPMSFFERYGPLETANSKNDHRCNLQMAGIDVQQRCVFRMLGRINSVDLSLPDVFIYAATAASRLAGASTIRLPIA